MLAFLPWAIALYAYPVVALPVGVSGLMIVILFRRKLAAHGSAWGIGILLALLLDLPFLLFLAKNQLRLGRLPLEGILPFSIPVLPATRLSQIHQSLVTTIFDNLTFILGAYRDGLTWHQSVFFLPLTGAMPFLTLLGRGGARRSSDQGAATACRPDRPGVGDRADLPAAASSDPLQLVLYPLADGGCVSDCGIRSGRHAGMGETRDALGRRALFRALHPVVRAILLFSLQRRDTRPGPEFGKRLSRRG